ncbi:alpha/beta-hydrolase [Thozetella sp. PMI_491]|nr:alpha/beta-hydrolase [Thozetella sp. PMI_491]
MVGIFGLGALTHTALLGGGFRPLGMSGGEPGLGQFPLMGAAIPGPVPKRSHDDTFCPAHVDHFTGSVSLHHGKEIFYWLFSSAEKSEDAPTIVWLTGGPGGASSYASVVEVGPCFLNVTTGNETYHNPWHWAKHANLLVVDQPAGVGFSQASPDQEHQVTSLAQATEDFADFLHIFMTSAFPNLGNTTLHIAAESYGGKWGPSFMHRLWQLQKDQSRRSIPNKLGTLILINAVIGPVGGDISTSNYEFGCTPSGAATKLGFGFNATACEKIAAAGPACEDHAAICERTYQLDICTAAMYSCEEGVKTWVDIQDRNPYNIAEPCLHREMMCIPGMAAALIYFNQKSLQAKLGINYRWEPVDFELNAAFLASGSMGYPSQRYLTDLLDSGAVRVLVMNGDWDTLVLTPGQIRVVDRLPWKGQADYRQQEWRSWKYDDGAGSVSHGKIKGSRALTFATFENAGHAVPGDDPAGAYFILKEWLEV